MDAGQLDEDESNDASRFLESDRMLGEIQVKNKLLYCLFDRGSLYPATATN